MNILIIFFFYSFIGWILEVGYAYYKKGRFINRGFLFMPFIPIYGLSAIFLHTSAYSLFYTFDPLNIVHLLTVFVMIGIISTSLELLGGALLLKLFEIRWWDYSHLPYNFKGFVALKFSLLWSIVGMILFAFVHHLIVNPYIASLSFETKSFITAPLVFIFILDWTYTVVSLFNVKKYIHELKNNVETIFEKSETLSSSLQPEKLKTLRANLHILVKQFRRHEYVSFIRSKIEQIKLQVTDIEKHSEETREPVDRLKRISNKLSKYRLFKVFPEVKIAIRKKGKDHQDNGKTIRNEWDDRVERFIAIGRDILFHPVYLKNRKLRHHDETVYEHTLMVAYDAYEFARRYTLDAVAITRGALLHDFFLYDWRKEGKRVKKSLFKKHGFTHARIAYENAKFYFPVNKKEKDIILKHMFPMTLKPPMYIESWAVNIIDNIVTYREYFKDRKESHKVLFNKVYEEIERLGR